ncbi:hypothetical protein AMJ44_05780 [candidate division WOR-1 bacterium DG_54_3]|uniref:Uncharacterized protein n=1 Tax=candidate division WOR-1 bacterium DG_54_3 TaxID=1703775 RepID=A0A0S7Y2P7_UNCSA|nr:MAG: hypothetical protein AMJ44_05780 [candidate division WOR-1 bacterium DG_54_3]
MTTLGAVNPSFESKGENLDVGIRWGILDSLFKMLLKIFLIWPLIFFLKGNRNQQLATNLLVAASIPDNLFHIYIVKF